MNLIQNNPYRILGLLVGASATQFNRHRTRIPNYINSGNAIPSEFTDFSFKTLGDIIRTEDNIANAASKLILDSDKMNAALFWFYKGNPITDEPAFDAIKEADLDQVLNIWTKLTSNGEVSQRNASAYSNLGTLYLSGILEGTDTNEALLEQGISLKLKFLESDYFKDFKALATDETFKTTKKEIQLLFLNQVQAEIEKSGGITSNKLLGILTKLEFTAKEDFLKGFVQRPIEEIERKIEEVKIKRKANNANSFSIGKALYEQSSESLSQLKSILGISNIKYSSISDKVSVEILQCGIDYFQYNRDNTEGSNGIPKAHLNYAGSAINLKFEEACMDLFRKAKTLAIGNIAKQRCQENTQNLQEWIDDKPERDKQKKVEEDLKFITSKLERFQNLSDSVSNAKDLVDSCKPKLANIKSVLGSTDDFYLKICSAVANNALGMLVTAVNEAQESIEVKIGDFSSLRSVVRSALSVSESIGSFDLVSQQRTHYSKNHSALKSIASQLGVSSSSNSPSPIRNTSSTSSSTSTNRPIKSSNSSSEEGIPVWIKWAGGIILYIIFIKSCG